MAESESRYRSLYYLCRFRESIEACDAVLHSDAANEDALWVKGMCFRELREFKNAITCFESVFNMNPSRIGAQMYAAVLTHCLDSPDAWHGPLSMHVGEQVMMLAQGASAIFANDYNEMGLYLANDGRFNEAVQWYDKALHSRPEHAIASFNKGIALARLQKFREAIQCFDHSLRIDAGYIDALYSKAGCAFELRDYRLAANCYEAVLRLNPNDVEARNCLDQIRNIDR